MSNLFSQQP